MTRSTKRQQLDAITIIDKMQPRICCKNYLIKAIHLFRSKINIKKKFTAFTKICDILQHNSINILHTHRNQMSETSSFLVMREKIPVKIK